MESTIVIQNIQRLKKEILPCFGNVLTVVEALDRSGARALLVGGAVRDLLLGMPVKDLDIEVHGIALEQLEVILKRFGNVRIVGKQFGVLRIDGIDVDWSIPRIDGAGRKPIVQLNPYLSLHDAFLRRDLTINAMGIDLITYQLQDPFNGQKDLENKVLKAPDPDLFVKDPLRFFRVMQFIGRFNMHPDAQLNALCKNMDLSSIATERIYEEYEKLLLKSARPSLGFVWLKKIERLKQLLPQLYDTIGVQQEFEWHPEGDVFEHSMQALDKAATIACENDQERLVLMFAALCHDLGKVTHTQIIDGRIRALGHDTAGVPLAQKLLDRLTHKQVIKETVPKLVQFHMMPGAFIKSGAKRAAYKRLAKKLAPQTHCAMLAKVAFADKCGRNPEKNGPLLNCFLPDIEAFVDAAQKIGVLFAPEAPVLMGADLLEFVKPGPQMGKMLEKAYQIQIDEGITDKETLKKRIL